MQLTLIDDPITVALVNKPAVVIEDLQRKTVEIIEPIPHFDIRKGGITFAPPSVKGTFTQAYVGEGGCVAFQVVFVAGDNTIRPANALEPSHAGRILGLVDAESSEGDYVTIRTAGEISNPAWTLEPGRFYFAAAGGEISLTPPSTGFIQRIGLAKTRHILVIQIGEAIMR